MAGVPFTQLTSAPYRATTAPALVEVGPINYLMIDGQGDPNSVPHYQLAVAALYTLAYGLKFLLKRRDPGLDFKVAPLEGLWWSDDLANFSMSNREPWRWTMMIAQPEVVSDEDLAAALVDAQRKRKPGTLEQVRLECYHEGLCAQILHLGPYSTEPPTIERLHAFIEAQGYLRSGKHHEIYLGDPRRTAPEKLKTILRQPIAQAR